MSKPSTSLRVWDLPTRVFHILLLLCVLGLVVTGKVGGNWIEWHARLGTAVLALLVWRLVWGLVGGRWSRFVHFIYAPRSVVAYLRGRAPLAHRVGHNPLGALSVFALLGVLLVQALTGLSSDDEIAFAGPLVAHLPGSWVSAATRWHKDEGQLLVLGLIGLHVLAILVYRVVKGERLVGAMLHGDKVVDEPLPPSRDDAMTRLGALVLLGVCGAAAAAVWRLGAPGW